MIKKRELAQCVGPAMNDGKRTLSINAKEIHTIIHIGPRSPASPKKEVTKYF